MGTRGFFAFHYKGKYYVMYNQFDSRPSGLGTDLLREIKSAIDNGTLDEWKAKLEALVIVNEDDISTPEQIEQLALYTDLGVSNQSTDDWYCLLRKTQGSYLAVLNAGIMMNYTEDNQRPKCDLFMEYVYILDFDTSEFVCSDGRNRSFSLDNLPEELDDEMFEQVR